MLIQFPSASTSYTVKLLNTDNTTLASYYVPTQGQQQRVNNDVVQALHNIAIAGQLCIITK